MTAAPRLARAAGSAVPPPSTATDPQGVVAAEHVRKRTGRVGAMLDVMSRRTTVSTGDRGIDAVGGTALRQDRASHRPRCRAANDDQRPIAGRRVAGDGQRAAEWPCLTVERAAPMVTPVDRHAAMRAAR